MPRITVPASRAGRAIRQEIIRRLQAADIAQTMVSRSKLRMIRSGDSEHRYPDLWDAGGRSYRTGGQPLRSDGELFNSLFGETTATDDGVSLTVASPHRHALAHQTGFETKGPNFIPLTLKARRTHTTGNNPEDEGLERGVDFIMAWQGVSVPQRMIYNTPPEDLRAVRDAIGRAIKGGV